MMNDWKGKMQRGGGGGEKGGREKHLGRMEALGLCRKEAEKSRCWTFGGRTDGGGGGSGKTGMQM